MADPVLTRGVVGKSGTVGSAVVILVEVGRMAWAHYLGGEPWPVAMPGVIEANLIVLGGSILSLFVGSKQ